MKRNKLGLDMLFPRAQWLAEVRRLREQQGRERIARVEAIEQGNSLAQRLIEQRDAALARAEQAEAARDWFRAFLVALEWTPIRDLTTGREESFWSPRQEMIFTAPHYVEGWMTQRLDALDKAEAAIATAQADLAAARQEAAAAQAERASLLAAVDAAIADREYFHAEEQRVVTALQRAAAVIGEIVIPSPLAYRYYVDNVICVHDRSTITGAEIKARAPDYGPGWSLYRHGKGNDPDVLVQDADVLVLSGERLMCLAIPPALSGGSADAQPPALPSLPADCAIAAVLAQEEATMPRDHIPEWAGARSYTDPMQALRGENAKLREQLTEARRVLGDVTAALVNAGWAPSHPLMRAIAAVLAQEEAK